MSDGDAQSYLVAARGLYRAGNYEGAERTCKQALAADPELPDAHILLSFAQYQRGKDREALETARAAIALSPTADAFRAECLALTQLGRDRKAVAAGQAAVAAEPTDEEAHCALGFALESANRAREAEAAFRAAVKLAPGKSTIRADLGRFLLRRNRLAAAEIEADGIDRAADCRTVLLLRGEIALRRGRAADARDFALWALASDATSVGALRLLAQVNASESLLLGPWWRCSQLAMKPLWARCLILMILLVLLPVFLVFGLYMRLGGAMLEHRVRRELKAVKLGRCF